MLSFLMTVPSRLPMAQLTLESARAAGFDPIVVCDVGLDGPRVMFQRLLEAAGDSRVVIMQDDVQLASGLRAYICNTFSQFGRRGQWSVLSAWASDRNVAGKPAGWHRAKMPTRADGAQCYAFNAGVASLIELDWRRRDWSAVRDSWALVDHWVGVACKSLDIGYFVHSPSLVQHVLPDHGTLAEAGTAECRVAGEWRQTCDGLPVPKLPNILT